MITRLLLCLLLSATLASLARGQNCPCGDNPPSADFTCGEQKSFGKCVEQWMIDGQFCACTCGYCDVEDGSSNVATPPVKPAPVEDATEDETEDATEEETEKGGEESILDLLAVEDAASLSPLKKLSDKKCKGTIYDAISSAKETTILAALVQEAGLEKALSNKKLKATIFAPTNEAFTAFLEESKVDPSELINDSKDTLSTILKYHVAAKRLGKKQLAKPTSFQTLAENLPLFGGSKKEIEGIGSSARIVAKSVTVCGSLIYLVDTVLMPAATVDEIGKKEDEEESEAEPASPECREGYDAFFGISSEDDLSTLTQVMNKLRISGDLADSKANVTVFAPTDDAFEAVLRLLGTTIDELMEDEDTLLGILQYHIVKGNLESDLIPEGVLKTMNGTDLYVERIGTRIELAGRGTSASVVMGDMDLACSSAVHKIDTVLLPFRVNGSTAVVSGSAAKTTNSPARSKRGGKTNASGCRAGRISLYQTLGQTRGLRVLTPIVQLSSFVPVLNKKSTSVTIFAPIDFAFSKLLEPGMGYGTLVPNREIADALLSYHTIGAPVQRRLFKDNLNINTMLAKKGKPLRIKIVENPQSPTGLSVKSKFSQANILQTEIIACNSVVHIIDSVLLPSKKLVPGGNVTFASATKTAELFDSLLLGGEEQENAENDETE